MAKISAFDIVGLLIALSIIAALALGVNYQYNTINSEIDTLKKKEAENNTIIQEHPMYKRLDAYGFQVNIAKNISAYKEYDIFWTESVEKLRMNLPKDVTIRSLQKTEDSAMVNMIFSAPSENTLLLAMKTVNALDEFSNADFSNITKENISFIGDKLQYVGYTTTATFVIDENLLKEKYLTDSELIEEFQFQDGEDINSEELFDEDTGNTISGENLENPEILPTN